MPKSLVTGLTRIGRTHHNDAVATSLGVASPIFSTLHIFSAEILCVEEV